MLSQGCEAEAAQALATGPRASQKTSSTATRALFFSIADQSIGRGSHPGLICIKAGLDAAEARW